MNGSPVAMLQADGALRGIALGPGRNEVMMTFRPRSFTWGAGVSALTLALAFIALVAAFVWPTRRDSARQSGFDGRGVHLVWLCLASCAKIVVQIKGF